MKVALRPLAPSERIAALVASLTAPRAGAPVCMSPERRRARRRITRQRRRRLLALAKRLCAALSRGLSQRAAAREVGCSNHAARAALALPARCLRNTDAKGSRAPSKHGRRSP